MPTASRSVGTFLILIYSGIAAASRRGCPASGGPRRTLTIKRVPNASGGVCAPPVYQILRAFKYSNRVFKSPTPCLAAAGKHITGSKSHSIRDYRIRCANLQLLHLRLCHRQDNTAAILRGRWGRRHDTAHEAADTAHQGAKAESAEAGRFGGGDYGRGRGGGGRPATRSVPSARWARRERERERRCEHGTGYIG